MSQTSKKRKNGHPRGIFSQVFVCANQELAPFGTAFLFPPENYLEQNLGTLFGVIKVDDHSPDSSYVVNLLTSVIRKEFFSKPDRSAEESFEASLRKANLALAELARHGSLNWSGKINFAAGAMEKNTLHFSSLGKAHAFLIRSGQIAEISRELEDEKEAEPHPLKTFSNISSGKMEKDDKLIFTTGDLLDIFSKEELRHNALHFSVKEFPGLIELSLQANSQLAGAIIVDMTDEPEIDMEPKHDSEIKNGIDLIPAPRKEITAPAFKPPLDIKEERSSHIYIKSEEAGPPPIKPFFEKLIDFSKKILPVIQNLITWISRNIISVSKQKLSGQGSTTPSGTEKYSDRMKNASQGFVSRTKKMFDSLIQIIRQKKKFFGIAILSVIVVLFIIFSYRWIKPKETVQTTAPSENIPSETSLPQIPDDVQIKKIDSTQEIVSFSEKVVRFAILDGVMYAIPENSKTVLKVNPESKNTEEMRSNIGESNFKLIAAMPHLKTLFMLDSNNKIISLTPVNKNFQENNIAFPDNLKASDMKTYLTYLYVLDSAASQVYRFPRAEGGFGEKQDWLKAGSDVKQDRSFTINEDLFAASEEEISAFLLGKKDSNITFEKPKIALAIDRIYSEPDMENVYVLDNKNHRVIKYSKAGQIIAQYWNESIDNIKDILVNEENKTAYLLSDKKISSFTME
jgi:hypothetical protein